jgi:hypothetical protein
MSWVAPFLWVGENEAPRLLRLLPQPMPPTPHLLQEGSHLFHLEGFKGSREQQCVLALLENQRNRRFLWQCPPVPAQVVLWRTESGLMDKRVARWPGGQALYWAENMLTRKAGCQPLCPHHHTGPCHVFPILSLQLASWPSWLAGTSTPAGDLAVGRTKKLVEQGQVGMGRLVG